MGAILVIGGHGDVGRAAVKELLRLTNDAIIIGGRNVENGEQFIRAISDDRVTFQKIDIYDESSYVNKLSGVSLAVMCLGPKNINFAEYCLKIGIHYIDISASNQTMNELVKLPLSSVNAQGILGVGICPGLSTILVKELADNFAEVEQTEISLLMEMGDGYGKDAFQWLLDNLSQPFYWNINGEHKKQMAFIKKKSVYFDRNSKSHSAFVFNLADQQIVTNTLNHPNVTTFFSLDDSLMLFGINILAKIRFFKLLKNRKLYNLALKFAKVSTRLSKRSTSSFSIHVKIKGRKENQRIILEKVLHGTNSSEETGKIAAYTASKLLESSDKAGIYYLHERFTLDNFSEYYKQTGFGNKNTI
ncbi:saccharopine dehydrogenase NADP-binding domain-containing protein [Enterococcus sp. DIV0756]|uniref:saccharopine dehydrogenase NADP-binding domain-containing protein n=1 Tax=Enterococcus sp. DIV0756 TaxID=2774636 RepID=UPI003F25D39C